ncbi:hypothetical protein [Vibrio casei]|uniref:hypothetical protein n=1 Tax=Vibrio casei TaxID=673372 RepID=UPI003F977D06
MKVYGLKQVEVVIDRRCDVCGNSVFVDCNGHKYEVVGELSAHWGYGSDLDGINHHLDICQDCFQFALSALKEHRRSIAMFDKTQELPDDNFGVNNS